ncbi:type II toxin-antitoxin system ParD family antitoxin [Sphingomonas sp.]|uniref:type II toxin-antitoxin system ParD family antitoxin n=1 Tax=Sphingomonas sp. TaxID=28214 RepID=UPI00333EEBC6
MDVTVGKRWEAFVEAVVADGSYGSADQVVVEGLRLVQERESKLAALRETIQASIARGGWNTIEEVEQRLKLDMDEWERSRK